MSEIEVGDWVRLTSPSFTNKTLIERLEYRLARVESIYGDSNGHFIVAVRFKERSELSSDELVLFDDEFTKVTELEVNIEDQLEGDRKDGNK